MKRATSQSPHDRPYRCEIDVAFPTQCHAQQARDVLRVDEELVDSVVKTFRLITRREAERTTFAADYSANERRFKSDDSKRQTSENGDPNQDDDNSLTLSVDECNVLRINFEAREAKILRVSVSSFYDMLNIVLKCHQEFNSDCNVISK